MISHDLVAEQCQRPSRLQRSCLYPSQLVQPGHTCPGGGRIYSLKENEEVPLFIRLYNNLCDEYCKCECFEQRLYLSLLYHTVLPSGSVLTSRTSKCLVTHQQKQIQIFQLCQNNAKGQVHCSEHQISDERSSTDQSVLQL